MMMSILPASRNAAFLLLSGLAAQVALLLRLNAQMGWLFAAGLVMLLFFTLAVGVLLMQTSLFAAGNTPGFLCLAFLINAAGLFLLLVACTQANNKSLLLMGTVISGLAEGAGLATILCGEARQLYRARPARCRLAALIIAISLAVMTCLRIQAAFAETAGFPYAFALLLDLALLGALWIKIMRDEN